MSQGRVLARNATANLVGQVLPMFVGLVAIPILVRALGASRFGILTLVWAAIGYFGLFDLGIGRALTHALATRIGQGKTDDLGSVTWTALVIMAALGIAGGIVFAALTPLMVDRLLNVPVAGQAEARAAFYITAAAVPVTLVATGLRGILEAFQDFPVAAMLRVPLATLNYLGPVAVLPFSHGLVPVVAALALVRLLGAVLHFVVCVRRYEFLRHAARVDRRLVSPLLRYGGWLTVTNVVSPLMANLDRFMIGAILPMAAVAYYVTPFEVASKVFIVPGAILGVLFPAVAMTFAADPGRTSVLFDRALRVVLAAVFPVSLVLVCLARPGLGLWINAEFARESTVVLQWLAAGVLINCAGQVAFTAIQGVGRPDLTAKTHLVELPLYLAGIWVLTHAYGLAGVAMAWTFRVTIDTTILLVLTMRKVPGTTKAVAAAARLLVVLCAALLAAATITSVTWQLIVAGAGTLVFAIAAWALLVTSEERVAILEWAGSALSRRTIRAS